MTTHFKQAERQDRIVFKALLAAHQELTVWVGV